MFLKRIEITGFKSFPDKYEIIMDDRITGIVGPNGSGKSNIADAVRWVLGEQSAKSLRGEKMEDVIFNGTELRRQKSYCEVSLTFNNEHGRILSDYSEIEIARKIYRSGESEYFINRTACRLKDVLELFRDTGIGKEGYSIIGQGRIDEILNEKALSRRKVFEEAAGVMKYRVRKEEAERKLVRTGENMERVRDIIDELELQMEPLKAQCEDAKRWLELKERQKLLELNVFLNTFERGRERVERLKKELKGLQDENEQKAKELERLSRSDQSEAAAAEDLDAKIARINAELSLCLTDIQRMEGERRLETERKRHVEQEAQRLREEALEMQRSGGEAAQRAEAAKRNIRALDADIEAMEAQARDLEQRLNGAQREDLQRALRQKRAEMEECRRRLSDLKSAAAADAVRRDALAAQRESLAAQMRDLDAALERNARDAQALAEREGSLRRERDALTENAGSAQAAHGDKMALLLKKAEEKRALERQLDEVSSRIAMQRDMRDHYEGYFESVKSLMLAAQRDEGLRARIRGTIAECIRVEERYETAVDAALGAAMQHIVVESEYDAKHLIEYLREKNLGRATFLPLQSLQVRRLSAEERSLLAMKGVIGVAAELSGTDEKARKAVDFLLCRTVVAQDMESAIALQRAAGHTFRTVTLQGDVLNAGGAITGGSRQKRNAGLISRERTIAQLEAKKEALMPQARRTDAEMKAVKQEAEALDAQTQRIRQAVHEKDVELARARESKGNLDAQREALRQGRAALEQRIRQAESEQAEALAGADQGRGLQQDLEQQEQGLAASVKELEARLTQTDTDALAVKDALAEARIAVASQRAARDALTQEAERLESEAGQAGRIAGEKQDRIAHLQSEARQIGEREQGLSADLAGENEKSARLKDALTDATEKKEALQARLRDMSIGLKELQDSLRALLERRHRAEMTLSRLETEIESAQERIWEDYRLTYANAAEFRQKINMAAAQEEIETIREEIRGMGGINPNAPEDFKRMAERRDFLAGQKEDLEKAIVDLETVIRELMHSMRQSFRDRFHIINEYFKEAFNELFGGGRAQLQLQDESDIMACGIDIIAEPPGKKLQSISLLSGGEKAMTAIALLFAMQKLNPSPVCILDEIDAALDDENLLRFTEYLKKYTKKVQFVVITHRKPTMGICDTLYGIAMEEKGVSRMLSVRMA